MPIPFVKMQGIGNDYVYVDATEKTFSGEEQLARKLSDRHFGIGSDGLIFIKRSKLKDVDYRMQMHNSDGSLSEMCGNGLRCVAKFVYDRGLVAGRPTSFPLETGAGVLNVEVTPDANHRAEKVRINMGEPRLTRDGIPMLGENDVRAIDEDLDVDGQVFEITAVGMGNPHCVIFVDGEASDELVHTIGPKIEKHETFPNRTNVEFVQVVNARQLIQRTWERGAGETLACGTGASAVCVAGVLTGRSQRKVTIRLLGGELELEWSEKDNCVYKTGPAVEVFSGVWPG